MKKMLGLILLALVPAAVVVYSFVWTGGGSRYDLCFYEKDKFHQSGATVSRPRAFSLPAFRSPAVCLAAAARIRFADHCAGVPGKNHDHHGHGQ
jgi:hypothetical protein